MILRAQFLRRPRNERVLKSPVIRHESMLDVLVIGFAGRSGNPIFTNVGHTCPDINIVIRRFRPPQRTETRKGGGRKDSEVEMDGSS